METLQNGLDRDKTRDQWLARLTTLVDSVEGWAQEFGWATRRIEREMQDQEIGHYRAPFLLLQEGPTRVLLEPVARSAPGADGVVDLYLMPAYDDIASLYFIDGAWQLHYSRPDGIPSVQSAEMPAQPLSRHCLEHVLVSMSQNAA